MYRRSLVVRSTREIDSIERNALVCSEERRKTERARRTDVFAEHCDNRERGAILLDLGHAGRQKKKDVDRRECPVARSVDRTPTEPRFVPMETTFTSGRSPVRSLILLGVSRRQTAREKGERRGEEAHRRKPGNEKVARERKNIDERREWKNREEEGVREQPATVTQPDRQPIEATVERRTGDTLRRFVMFAVRETPYPLPPPPCCRLYARLRARCHSHDFRA